MAIEKPEKRHRKFKERFVAGAAGTSVGCGGCEVFLA